MEPPRAGQPASGLQLLFSPVCLLKAVFYCIQTPLTPPDWPVEPVRASAIQQPSVAWNSRILVWYVAESNGLLWNELSASNFKEQSISDPARWDVGGLVHNTRTKATYRDFTYRSGECVRQIIFQHVSGFNGTAHAARAPLPVLGMITSSSHLFSPSSPFDGTSPPLRSRNGHMARPLRHPWLLAHQPVSRFGPGFFGAMSPRDTFRSGRRARLRMAPSDGRTRRCRAGEREREGTGSLQANPPSATSRGMPSQ